MNAKGAPRSIDVTANGLRHHVRAWDGDAARTCVIVHGYLDHGASFASLGDSLAERGWRVYATDLRGHGRSAWIPDGGYYHFADYVADLDALASQLVPSGTLAIVGHSMGGTLSTMYAGTRPERVSALVLAEGVGIPAMPPEVAPDRTRLWLDGLAKNPTRERRRMRSLGEVVDRLQVAHRDTVPRDVLERVAVELTQVHPSGDGLAWRFDPWHQTTSPSRFDADAFEAYARRVTAPVLLIDGGDTGYNHAESQHRATFFANARSSSMPGAGHMMHWSQGALFNDRVGKFLDETVPR